jgi:microcystin degradation protein MlrC
MRLLLASFKHETNTFSPVLTPFERFFTEGVAITDEMAIKAHENSGGAISAFIRVARAYDAQIVVPVVAEAWPSGPVDNDAFERIAKLIVDAAAVNRLDGILLDLHGAMVTTNYQDAEGELVRRLRQIQPDIPFGVTMDMHANVYPDMVARINVLTGYHTYPHVDIFEAGTRAAEILCKAIKGELHPVLAFDNRPMLPHIMRQGTHEEPNRSLQAKCKALEYDGGEVLSASLFTGFPHADITQAGLSVVICTNYDKKLATKTCQDLLEDAWIHRKDFVYEGKPLNKSVALAKEIERGPVVLLDHCDNVASGGTMDTTAVLQEVLHQGLTNATFYAIHDPETVRQAIHVGIGNTAVFTVGGREPLFATKEQNIPLAVTAKVKTISDGCFFIRGPMYSGFKVDTGHTIVLDTGTVEIVVTSKHMEPMDLNCFSTLGIDPTSKHYLILKSRVHWRAAFGGIFTDVIECDGVGVTTSDYSKLTFTHVRRPIFPLDDI